MATRLYLTNAAAGFTPTTKRGAWTVSSSTVVQSLGRRPSGAAATTGVAETSATNPCKVLLGRWVSDAAVAAGTLSGTAQWVMGVVESSASADDYFHVHIFVTAGDTDTVRGTLLADYTPGAGTEWTTTATGRGEGAQNLTSVVISVGDRICVEVGYQSRNTSTSSFTGTLDYGNTGTTDLTQGSTNTTTEPGWIEFSGADELFNTGVHRIRDTFSAGSIDSAIWQGTAGTVGIASGKMQIDADGYGALYAEDSPPFLRLAGSSVYFEVPGLPTDSAAYAGFKLKQNDASNNNVGIYHHPGTNDLTLENMVGGSDGSMVTLTYDATAHRWWRIRHDGTSLYWETAPDGHTWTVRRTVATAPSWTLYSDLEWTFEAGSSGTPSDLFEIDNVNYAPIRAFDGASGTKVTVSPGSVASLTPASHDVTMAFLWKPTSASDDGLIRIEDSANAIVYAVNTFGGQLFLTVAGDGFDGSAHTYGASDGWRIDVVTKVAGLAGQVRWHGYRLEVGTWAHANGGTKNDPNNGLAVDEIHLGLFDGSFNLAGKLGAVGIWTSVLSDGNVETLDNSLQAWKDLNPVALWRFNQASTATAVEDLTGGGADETADVGTSVVGDAPAGFDFTVTSSGVVTIEGTISGTGAFAGTEALTIPVSGSMSGTGAASGTQFLTIPVVGSVAGTGAASGTEFLEIPVTGTLAGTGAASGTATVTGAGGGTTHDADGSVAGSGALAGSLTLTHAATGSWFPLKAIVDEARAMAAEDREMALVACPNDGEPLQTGPDGRGMFCSYDGYRTDALVATT